MKNLIILLFVFLFSFWLLKNALFGLLFTVGILVTFAIMAGISSLFMKLINLAFGQPRSSLGYIR